MLHTHINSESQLLLHLFLGRITFLRFEEKNLLARKIPQAEKLSELSLSQISELIHRKFNSNVIWNGKENLRMANAALHRCKALDIQLLFNFDLEYP